MIDVADDIYKQYSVLILRHCIFCNLSVFRPDEFLKCDPPKDLQGNTTAREELGYGCTKVGRHTSV